MSLPSIKDQWKDAQAWERSWWLGNPDRHETEMRKGLFVARLLGIGNFYDKSVIDIGCGPFSLLQRFPARRAVALDPLDFGPLERAYRAANIERVRVPAEHFKTKERFDEAWIYNCLQHVMSPEAVLSTALGLAATVRIFEWVDIPAYQGHLHMITADMIRSACTFWNSGHTEIVFCEGVLNDKANELVGNFCVAVYTK